MGQGVRLLIEPGVKVPEWIFENRTRAQCPIRQIKGRLLQVLTIPRGKASFMPGGAVNIFLPGSGWVVGFDEHTVLEIRFLKNGTRQINYNLCLECMRLSGKIVSQTESSRRFGYYDTTFNCDCGHTWTRLI